MAWHDIIFYELFPQVFNMSITGTLIILAVICVRFLLKKAPKLFSYALWAVVLFRLLCPISFSLDVSFLNQFDVPVTESGSIEYVPAYIVHMEEPGISPPISVVNDVVNERLPQGREQLVADPLEAPVSIITYIWFLGIAALVIYSAVQYVKLRRKLIGATPLRGNIFLADYIDSPFVMGLVFPRIYLPSSLSETEQEYVILHEKHHVKRGDHIIKVLAFAALCIHWFNPFVWLAFVLSGKDMEMSCDEAVIGKMNHDIRAEYATSLLRFATGRKLLVGTPLAFGERNTKDRVKNVMKYKKPLLWLSVTAGVVIIVAAVMLMANPSRLNTLPLNRVWASDYKVKQILYVNGNSSEDSQWTKYMSAKYYSVCFADDRVILFEKAEDNVDWNNLGNMQTYSLDKSMISEITLDNYWLTDYTIAEITDAYVLHDNKSNQILLIAQTAKDNTLLCCAEITLSEPTTSELKIVKMEWILQLESLHGYPESGDASIIYTFLEAITHKNINSVTTLTMQDKPEYQIIGFMADDTYYNVEDMRDMGFAVLKADRRGGYTILDYHVYENAALMENGIYFAPDPAVYDEKGIITDETAYDVILSKEDSGLTKIVRILDNGTELTANVGNAALNITLFHWKDQAKSKTVMQYYYDAAGNIINDTGVIIPSKSTKVPSNEVAKIRVGSQTSDGRLPVNKLTSKDAEYILELLESATWLNGTADCFADCVFGMEDGSVLYYHSECGSINDNKTRRCIKLNDVEQSELNSILSKYVTLGYVEMPIEEISLKLPSGATRLDEEELKWFAEQYFSDPCMNIFHTTNYFLKTDYAAPEEINLFELFTSQLMFFGGSTASPEEKEQAMQLANAEGKDNISVSKITSSEMSDVLKLYTGITLEETQKVGLDKFVYLEEYDAYYLVVPNERPIYRLCVILDGYRTEDGQVVLMYEDPSLITNGSTAKYIVTLRKATDGSIPSMSGYYIYSNVPK